MVVVNHVVTEGSFRFFGESKRFMSRKRLFFVCFCGKRRWNFDQFGVLHESRGCCGFTMRIRFVYFVFKVFKFWIYLWGHKNLPCLEDKKGQQNATKKHHWTRVQEWWIFPQTLKGIGKKYLPTFAIKKINQMQHIHWVFGILTLEFGVKNSP